MWRPGSWIDRAKEYPCFRDARDQGQTLRVMITPLGKPSLSLICEGRVRRNDVTERSRLTEVLQVCSHINEALALVAAITYRHSRP